LEVALGLVPNPGAKAEASLERLPVTGNNRLFLLRLGGNRYVVKQYFRHAGDDRDRLHAEFSFGKFLWDNGVRCIAEPIGRDEAASVGVYRYVDGRKPLAGEIREAEVLAALAFFTDLNRFASLPAASSLPPASEACFSIGNHIGLVDRRVRRLQDIATEDDVDRDAGEFIAGELTGKWDDVRDSTIAEAARAGLSMSDEIAREDLVLSPSDFGFHNALLSKNGMIFVDFEYAGWDDPAKTVCDFFCQVQVPSPARFFPQFCEAAADLVRDREGTIRRARLLLPLYAVKWVCIVLNHFLPVGRERKAFSGQDAFARKSAQLAKARSLLSAPAPTFAKGW
jgi:hypothetical protein